MPFWLSATDMESDSSGLWQSDRVKGHSDSVWLRRQLHKARHSLPVSPVFVPFHQRNSNDLKTFHQTMSSCFGCAMPSQWWMHWAFRYLIIRSSPIQFFSCGGIFWMSVSLWNSTHPAKKNVVGFCYPLCHYPGRLRSYCSCTACAKVWGSNLTVSMLNCPSKQNWRKGIAMIEWDCVAHNVGWYWLCGVGLLFVKVICIMFPPSQCLSLDSDVCPEHLSDSLCCASRENLRVIVVFLPSVNLFPPLVLTHCDFQTVPSAPAFGFGWFANVQKKELSFCLQKYIEYGKYDQHARSNDKHVQKCQSNLELVALHTGPDEFKPLMLHMNVLC